MTGPESQRPAQRPTHRPPSNIEPKTLIFFLILMFVVVGLLSLGIWYVFGGQVVSE